MGKLLSLIKTPKGIVGLSLILIILIAIPLTVFLVQNRQSIQQFAHTPQPTVTTFCQNSEIIIAYTYTISNLPTGVTANVAVSDSQHYVTDSFTVTTSSPPYSKQVGTGKPSILAGILTFQTTASDGFKKTNQLGYPAAGPCASPSPTPTNTPVPTQTPTPTQIPSLTPILTPTLEPTITITPTNTPVPSVTLTLTITPGITDSPTPTNTPVPSTTPTIVTTETPTATPTQGQSPTNTPTPTVIPTTTILPPTGPTGIVSIGLIGLALLFIGGLLIFAL